MKATYHQSAGVAVVLDVLVSTGHAADLGRAQEVLVAAVPIALTGEPGTCTLIGDSEAAKAGQSGPHGVILPERTEALRLAALAIDARKLADDAKGQQGVGALREAAEAAEKAAKEADTAADAAEAASA